MGYVLPYHFKWFYLRYVASIKFDKNLFVFSQSIADILKSIELAILILNAGMAREKGNFSYSKIWWYWCADTGKSQTWCNVWPQIRTMASYSGLSPASLPANNNNNQHEDQPRHSSSRVNTAFCASVCKGNICLFLSYRVKCGTMLLFVFTNSADHKSKFHLCHQHTGQSGTWTDICTLSLTERAITWNMK